MRKILNIFFNDIKAISKRFFAIVSLAGILLIPGIYAWLNIGSSWDPYGNTGELPIAIVNKDKGTIIFDEEINVGNNLIEELRKNKDIKWKIESKEKEKKVKEELEKSKNLYGEILIPEDFSKNFTTVFESKNIQKPILEFHINNKRNPIAPIIVDKAEKTVENTLNQKFVHKLLLKILNKASDINLVAKTSKTIDELIERLDKAKNNIDNIKDIFKTLNLAAESTNKSLGAFRNLLPTVNSITGSTQKGIKDLKNSLVAFKGLTDNIQDIVTSVENEGKEIVDIVESFDLSPQKENGQIISDTIDNIPVDEIVRRMDSVSDKLTDKTKKIEDIKSFLSGINNNIQLDQLNALQDKLRKIVSKINKAKKNITNNVSDAKKVRENNKKMMSDIRDISGQIKDIHAQDKEANEMYKDLIKSDLDDVYVNASKSMDGVTNLMSGIDKAMGKTDVALGKIMRALDNSKELNDNMNDMLDKLQDHIGKIIDTIEEEREKEIYDKIKNLLESDPGEIADFISNPVQTDKKQLYYIEKYGSRMLPFFTILACWVGCLVLISIIKTTVEKTPEYENYRNYQLFLGRFMLFGIMALLQGFFIAVGDIVLEAKIEKQPQIKSYPLFLLTVMTASVVFMLFIYSITLSFGKVGHALSIVILVLQVAGSGGTFPVELLPRVYQVLQPVMPFYPAMNALREIVGGFYKNDYLYYMMMLLAHTIVPLLLGLLFRTPLIHLKEKVEKELEKTNILI